MNVFFYNFFDCWLDSSADHENKKTTVMPEMMARQRDTNQRLFSNGTRRRERQFKEAGIMWSTQNSAP